MSALPRPPRLALPVAATRVRERWVVLALVAVVVVGGGLRLAAAAGPHPPLSADARAYAALAADVAGPAPYGSGMREPFHWPPGAPVLFGLAQTVDPAGGLRAVYALQALLGTLLVLVVFALGAVVAGRRAGLAAAAVVAVYPPLVALAGSVLSEGPGTLLLALATLATVVAAKRAGPWWTWAGAGLLWGAAILTRADFLLAPLLVAVVLLLAATPRRAVVTLLLGTATALLPWSVYASQRAGAAVPVTTGGGPALFVGTYLPGGGTTLGAKRVLAADVAARYPGTIGRPATAIPAPLMLEVVAQRHPGRERDAAIAAEARHNLARYPLVEPVAYAGMTLDKLRRMWLAPSRVGAPEAPWAVRLVHPVLVLAAIALALLALWRTRSVLLALVLAPVLYAAALHAIVVANPRYALVALPLLAVAGVAGALQAGAGTSSAPSRAARGVVGIRRLSIRSR